MCNAVQVCTCQSQTFGGVTFLGHAVSINSWTPCWQPVCFRWTTIWMNPPPSKNSSFSRRSSSWSFCENSITKKVFSESSSRAHYAHELDIVIIIIGRWRDWLWAGKGMLMSRVTWLLLLLLVRAVTLQHQSCPGQHVKRRLVRRTSQTQDVHRNSWQCTTTSIQ